MGSQVRHDERRAPRLGERLLPFGVQVLTGEDQHAVLVERREQLVDRRLGELVAEPDAGDLGADGG